MPESRATGPMVSEGATHHRSFSVRRAILVCYAIGLFFATHNPLVHAESAEGMRWWDGLLWGLVRLGHSLRLDRPDKWFHLAAFCVLGLLTFWATSLHRRGAVSGMPQRWMTGGWMTVVGLLIWSWLDEVTQPFFGRHFDWNDYLANVAGIFLAVAVVAFFYLLRRLWHLIRNELAPAV